MSIPPANASAVMDRTFISNSPDPEHGFEFSRIMGNWLQERCCRYRQSGIEIMTALTLLTE